MDGKSDATRIETTRIILFLSRSRQNMINNLNFGSVKSLDIVPLDSSLGETRRHRLARNHTINPRLTATLLPRFSRKINVIYLYARAYGRERSTATTFRKKPGSPPVNRAACTEIYVYRGARGKRTLIERNCWATPPTSLPLLVWHRVLLIMLRRAVEGGVTTSVAGCFSPFAFIKRFELRRSKLLTRYENPRFHFRGCL